MLFVFVFNVIVMFIVMFMFMFGILSVSCLFYVMLFHYMLFAVILFLCLYNACFYLMIRKTQLSNLDIQTNIQRARKHEDNAISIARRPADGKKGQCFEQKHIS